MPIPLGILAVAGAGGAGAGAYELIETAYGSGSSSSITFSNIPQTYKHLQIRYVAKVTDTGGFLTNMYFRFNGVSTASYTVHAIVGNGSSASVDSSSSSTYLYLRNGLTYGTNIHAAGIIDILDYTSTSKIKSSRGLGGAQNTSESIIGLNGGILNSTSAISSITLLADGTNLATTSRFSLYGLKG